MKVKRKIISLIMVVCIIVATMSQSLQSTATDLGTSQINAQNVLEPQNLDTLLSNKDGDIISKRTPYSKTYSLGGDEYLAVYSTKLLHKESSNGSLINATENEIASRSTTGSANSYTSAEVNLRDAYPNNNYNNPSNLMTGKTASGNTRRALIKFPLLLDISFYSINNATLYICTDNTTNANGRNIVAVRNTTSWNKSSVTWNTKPTFTTMDMPVAQFDSQLSPYVYRYSINVTSIMKKWHSAVQANGTNSISCNYGFTIKHQTEAAGTGCTWHSSASSNAPYMVVQYSAMSPRTINMNVVVDKTYRDAKGSSYLTTLQNNDMVQAEYPFQKVWNINFNETYYADTRLPNHTCPKAELKGACDLSLCGSNCSNHHRGWDQAHSILNTYYTPAAKGVTVGVVGTGICYSPYNHSTTTILGLALNTTRTALLPKPDNINQITRIRSQIHEISHLFYATHNGESGHNCTSGQRCIMNSGLDSVTNLQLRDLWCDACKDRMRPYIEANF